MGNEIWPANTARRRSSRRTAHRQRPKRDLGASQSLEKNEAQAEQIHRPKEIDSCARRCGTRKSNRRQTDKFKKAYARLIEPFGDRATWLKVFFTSEVGTPILKRVIRQQRKNRIKGCREGRNSKKATATGIEKAKKIIYGKFKCSTYHQLVIGKIAQSAL
jgi:hypothetical protein